MKKKVLLGCSILGMGVLAIGGWFAYDTYQNDMQARERYAEALPWYEEINLNCDKWILSDEEAENISSSMVAFEEDSIDEKISESVHASLKDIYDNRESYEIIDCIAEEEPLKTENEVESLKTSNEEGVTEVEIVGTELTKEELGEELSLSGEGLERAYEDYVYLMTFDGGHGLTPFVALESIKGDIGLYITAEEGVEYDWSGSSSASSSGSAGGNTSSSAGTASQPSQSTNAGEQGYPSTYSYESQLDYVPETDAELAAENGWGDMDFSNAVLHEDNGSLIAE